MPTFKMVLPDLKDWSYSQACAHLLPGDVLLCKFPKGGKVRRLLQWGQEKMLRRFGCDKATAKRLKPYVHTLTVTKVSPEKLEGFEADLQGGIAYIDIPARYPDAEFLVLRPAPELSEAELADLLAAIPTWEGVTYDLAQYLIYPFYMMFGGVPGRWDKIWNDPDKPVCSGLSIRLMQAAGRLDYIKDVEAYPPGRVAMISGLRGMHCFRFKQLTDSNTCPRPRYWWR